MMNAPYIDPISKDYQLVNGNILNKDILITRMQFALDLPFGAFIFDRTRGCRIQNQIGNRQVTNKKTLEKYVQSALTFMVLDGSLSSLNVICTEYTLRNAVFNIYAIASNDEEINFTWTLPL